MVTFNNANPPPNVVRVPRWTIALHAVQFIFAIIVLGLSAYGIAYIPYNALIFSLVVALCTLACTLYLTLTQLFLHKLYHGILAFALHVWMLVFWVVDLGLVANLARIWASPSCSVSYSYFYGYTSQCYYKRGELVGRGVGLEGRGLEKRDTTVGMYYGALAAGAVFGAVQLITWALSAIILFIHFQKHRANTTTTTPNTNTATTTAPTTTTNTAGGAPPQYAPVNSDIPMEKYTHQNNNSNHQPYNPTSSPPPPHIQQQAPQPTYNPHQHQHTYQTPQQQQQQQTFSTATTSPYPQDPIPRQDTVSPAVSHFGQPHHHQQQQQSPSPQSQSPYPNASELSSPVHSQQQQQQQQQQYTGAGGAYSSNVSELSSAPYQPKQHGGGADLPELSDSR